MRFEITTRVHFDFMREVGVYDDLTPDDAANLSAPRPGLPNGFGRVVASPAEPAVVETVKEQEPADEDTPAVVNEPPAVGAGSDGEAERPSNPEQGPFPCRSEGCRKGPFPAKVGRDTHERKAHGRVLG